MGNTTVRTGVRGGGGVARRRVKAEVLEAATCLTAGLDEDRLAGGYGAEVMDLARPMRGIGLRQLCAECARLEGKAVPRAFGNGTETVRAAFSTVSLPGIIENVMHKTMLAAYQAAEIAALKVCAVGSVPDFKELSRYRLLGTGRFEKAGPDGELKHGRFSEQKYSNRADTYGQVVTLTRQDVINDDLGAFLEVPRQMGGGAAELVDELFFALLFSNPGNFFSAANGNYLVGADTAFGPDSLTVAKTVFRKQTAGPSGKDQRPVNIRPEILLVPVEIETDAEVLLGSAQLMMDGMGTKTKLPADNPHRGKYRLVSTPHLSDDAYAGSSSKAWYLFASPLALPAFEVVFLAGKREPTVEQVPVPANVLGLSFRGYLDVGVREQDHRGAVKVKGEA